MIGGVGLIIRELQRPRTGRAGRLNADHRRALAEVVEAGPVPATWRGGSWSHVRHLA